MKSSKEALATHLGMDIAELKNYVYQSGYFTKPVYTIENRYYCCSKNTPAKSRDSYGTQFIWIEVKDEFVNKHGWKIFMNLNLDV